MTTEPDPTASVLDILRLEDDPGAPDLFTGRSLPQPRARVFGGQVLAQAVLAAGRTVSADRLPHSMHGYFLRAGDVREPITFSVERLRDGRSFSARRTHALQGGEAILSMIASFQEDQPGLDYSDPMPAGIPGPDEVRSAHDLLSGIDHPSPGSGRRRPPSTSGTSAGRSTSTRPRRRSVSRRCGSGRAVRCPTTSSCTARCSPTRATR